MSIFERLKHSKDDNDIFVDDRIHRPSKIRQNSQSQTTVGEDGKL
jgi:hypothetical protein